MTDREKLVYLIKENAKAIVSSTENGVCVCLDVEAFADYLIAHGVTVKEPQKPLELEEATGTNNIVWYERKSGKYRVIPCDAVFSHIAGFVELTRIGYEKPMYCPENSYGKDWRCWAEKPTDAEREDAEWE